MRALQVNEFADPSKISVSEVPERDPGASEVKIRVGGVGIGYFDGLLVKGEYQIKPPLPFIPGSSIAGEVESVGDKVTNVKPGDKLAAFTLLGGLAEKAVLPADSIVKLPDSIDLEEAANFFIAYATGVLGLKELARTRPGEKVMILGASGTTGSTAIEIAKAMGAEVIACASTEEKRDKCIESGADHAIDYTLEDWRKQVKAIAPDGVDVVYDPIGGRWAETALRSMAAGGRYLIVGFVDGIAQIPFNLPLLKRCAIMGVNWGGEVFANPGIVSPVINQIIEWAVAGKLKTAPDKVYALDEASEAFAALFNRQSVGKIVINPSR
ncbi:MAG: NADPH:quinone oxidoreductase family protein [Ketobacteraceae bacterium]|nr:NADPH:quinone oxidoreductase family protein [Ketobacteraceae bacterium]